MEAFGNDLVPASDASLPGAYWLDSALEAGDDCVWCARMLQDSAPEPDNSVVDRPGFPANGTVPGLSLAPGDSRLALRLWMVMLSVTVCTVVPAMLAMAMAMA
ncbi:hypothetical protein [Streptomyces sp. NPDC055287]